jgi:hypothetical protein
VLYGHAAYLTALLRSNLPDSHFQTGGIATDNCRKYKHFSFLQEKKLILWEKHGTAFHNAKCGLGRNNNQVNAMMT